MYIYIYIHVCVSPWDKSNSGRREMQENSIWECKPRVCISFTTSFLFLRIGSRSFFPWKCGLSCGIISPNQLCKSAHHWRVMRKEGSRSPIYDHHSSIYHIYHLSIHSDHIWCLTHFSHIFSGPFAFLHPQNKGWGMSWFPKDPSAFEFGSCPGATMPLPPHFPSTCLPQLSGQLELLQDWPNSKHFHLPSAIDALKAISRNSHVFKLGLHRSDVGQLQLLSLFLYLHFSAIAQWDSWRSKPWQYFKIKNRCQKLPKDAQG